MNLKRLLVALVLSVFAFGMQAMAQDKVVTGKITDANGAAVSNVTIKLKDGKALGTSKSDGTFTVKVPGNAVLQFSSVGFNITEMQVPANGTMTISLKGGNDNLGEVVVIGYGNAKKKDLTGSVVAVTSKDFVKGALTSPEQLITGKVAGVSITPNGGAPGSGSVIRIRGGSSVNASNDPLIIIDDVPMDGTGISGSANILNTINPNDIESFNVLKDASAAAIYGSRASNGVIIIKTKRGKLGKATFNFSSNTSIYTPSGKVDVMGADDFRNYVNANGTANYKALLGTANTDWQKEIYRTAIGSDNNISMSGALFKKVPFRASLGYLNQQGMLRGGNLKRTTASISASPKFFKDALKVEINLKGVITENKFANEGAIGAAVYFNPTTPIYSNSRKFNGYWEWLDPNSTTGLKSLAPLNPLGILNDYNNHSHVERSIGNVNFDYKMPFLKDLRAVVNIGYDIAKGHGTVIITDSAASGYKRFKDANGIFHGGTNNMYLQEKRSYVVDAYLNYTKSTSAGDFDVLVGHSYQENKNIGYNFKDRTYDLSYTDDKPLKYDFGVGLNAIESYYGRLRYSYKEKYYLSGSLRRDGSSKVVKENRWGTFPSASLAWRISNESFLKKTKWINDLKLRASYGATGQVDGISDYGYLPNYSMVSNQSSYQFGNSFLDTIYTPLPYNGNIKWESTRMMNYGIDFSLFNNKVSGYIEYYDRETKDLFFSSKLSAGSQFSNEMVINSGVQTNKGVELSLNIAMSRKKDFTWDLGFNISYNKNTITQISLTPNPSIPGQLTGGIAGGTGNTVQIQAVDHARNSFYVYKQVYGKDGKPLDGVFEDLNRDGAITEKDLVFYKNPEPSMFAGLTSNFTYKKWTMGIVMRGSYDNYIYNNVRSSSGVRRNILNPIGVIQNGSTEVLKTNLSGNGDAYYKSNYWIENASFIKIDNINVSYNFGKVFNNKANLRVSGNVQNVATITKYSGLDPEVSGGIDNSIYVRPRVFTVGVSLDF